MTSTFSYMKTPVFFPILRNPSESQARVEEAESLKRSVREQSHTVISLRSRNLDAAPSTSGRTLKHSWPNSFSGSNRLVLLSLQDMGDLKAWFHRRILVLCRVDLTLTLTSGRRTWTQRRIGCQRCRWLASFVAKVEKFHEQQIRRVTKAGESLSGRKSRFWYAVLASAMWNELGSCHREASMAIGRTRTGRYATPHSPTVARWVRMVEISIKKRGSLPEDFYWWLWSFRSRRRVLPAGY